MAAPFEMARPSSADASVGLDLTLRVAKKRQVKSLVKGRKLRSTVDSPAHQINPDLLTQFWLLE